MHFENTISWKTVSKDEYISSVSDKEKLYYIHTEDGVPYLRADIEYGGEIHPRVELYAEIYNNGFCLTPSKYPELNIHDNISKLVGEIRGYYAGGICFIEYQDKDTAEKKVLYDFMHFYEKGVTPIYIRCIESSLHQLVQVFPNADLFIQIVDEIKAVPPDCR